MYFGNVYNSPGIYFENLGQTNFYNTEWNTVVYVNFKQVLNQSDLLEEYIGKVDEMYQGIYMRDWTGC